MNAIALNSVKDDGSPWLTKDGATMYLFSNREGGLGLRDIWVSTRPPLDDVDEDEDSALSSTSLAVAEPAVHPYSSRATHGR